MQRIQIVIADGRPHFYQWDVNRRIILLGVDAGCEVHFGRPDGGAWTVETYEEDGRILAKVPDEWLQLTGALPLYVWLKDHTVYRHNIIVRERPKPDGYAYTETEVLLYSDLARRIKALEDGDETDQLWEQIADLQTAVADLQYVPIDITSITNNIGTVELGTTVDAVTITWALNKAPVSQTVNGEAVDASLCSVTLTGLAIKADKSFTVAAVDERDSADSASTSVKFLNGVYYGAAEAPETIDSAFTLSLQKTLAASRGRTITVTAGEGAYIWYALPVRLGACSFTVGGFEGGFDLVQTLDFTNAQGYTESYYIYRSGQTGLGETKVVIS